MLVMLIVPNPKVFKFAHKFSFAIIRSSFSIRMMHGIVSISQALAEQYSSAQVFAFKLKMKTSTTWFRIFLQNVYLFGLVEFSNSK